MRYFFFSQRSVVSSPFMYVNIHLCIYYFMVGEELLNGTTWLFLMKPKCCKCTGCQWPLPTNASGLISTSSQVVLMDRSSWFTYQLCNSAKAALIFFTELSTSSLIIIRYLVRETVQRCKSFTDFSMFGPKIDNKHCTKVRNLFFVFLNEGAGIVQYVICPH